MIKLQVVVPFLLQTVLYAESLLSHGHSQDDEETRESCTKKINR